MWSKRNCSKQKICVIKPDKPFTYEDYLKLFEDEDNEEEKREKETVKKYYYSSSGDLSN